MYYYFVYLFLEEGPENVYPIIMRPKLLGSAYRPLQKQKAIRVVVLESNYGL